MGPDAPKLRQAVLPEALAGEAREELAPPIEQAAALGAHRHVVAGVGVEHLDHRRVARGGEPEELADLVEHALGRRLELVGRLDEPEEGDRGRHEHAPQVRVRRLRGQPVGPAAVDGLEDDGRLGGRHGHDYRVTGVAALPGVVFVVGVTFDLN